ncbi:MAG: leucyl/phenylalanyl-tRNA--protein transferase [Sulfuricella sp.]|nr:leucyl/phenylalanyl-tRNA--protein transferase [Sulfuricella sp.]
MIPWLDTDTPFPPLDSALREPNGLLAAGGDLSPQRLIEAYRRGIFPWFNPGEPVLWWSPDPRMVLFPGELKVSRSLRKALKNRDYEIRADTAFRQVMEACAAPRDGHGGTWITPAMISAYTELHRQGLAHSVETWMEGKLVGGLYGVSLGRMFYGESMFSLATDASKIAFVHLVRQLERWGFGMIDCQMKTAHLASLGAREIPRAEFSQKLSELVNFPGINAAWQFDHELAE